MPDEVLSVLICCKNCKHCEIIPAEADDDEITYRCGVLVPYWVPSIIHDYESWVEPGDGVDCQCFELNHENVHQTIINLSLI